MGKRHRARELALQALYLMEFSDQGPESALAEVQRLNQAGPEVYEFGCQLLAAVHRHRDELDRAIQQAADNWSLARMATVDRNILRLGAAQLCYLADAVPPKVAIDESIELAKNFGEEDSGRFINGILDRIYRDLTARQGGPGKEAAP